MPSPTLLHPLSSSSLSNLLRLTAAHGCAPAFYPRFACLALASLLRQPIHWLAAAACRRRIDRQRIEPAPVFIVGHWRSGTTHLQNLLSQDPRFGRVTLLQAALPREYLLLPPRVLAALGKTLPATRLMDNVAVAAEAPWEEEMALASYGPLSFYHVSFFPGHCERIFRRAVLFDGGDPDLVAQWRRQYLHFLRQVQLTQPGQPLLLKNPANTARIGLLRQMFPGARFIHIHRHPYRVYASTVHLYLKVQQAWGLQATDRGRLERHVLCAYRELMAAYFAQSTPLDEQHLVEISFDDLQRRPLGTLGQIYEQLGLADFAGVAPRIQAYLQTQRGYRKNRLPLNAGDKRRIGRCWDDSFQRLGYRH